MVWQALCKPAEVIMGESWRRFNAHKVKVVAKVEERGKR